MHTPPSGYCLDGHDVQLLDTSEQVKQLGSQSPQVLLDTFKIVPLKQSVQNDVSLAKQDKHPGGHILHVDVD